MVAKDFVELFAKFNYANRVAVEDFSDRLNLFTMVLLLLACVIVSAKQYFLNSISCYIAVKPSGDDYKNYLTDYCWVHGTIPLRSNELMPQTPQQWEEYDRLRRITYYQWVPFMLGLQCILFYLPHIAWQAVCAHRSGGDLFALIKAAADASILDRSARSKQIERVANFLEDMLYTQRDVHKFGRRRQITEKAYRACGICVVSKRLGTCLVYSYLMVKLLTIGIAIFQLILIQRFLGFHSGGSVGHESMELATKNDDPNTLKNVPSPQSEDTSGFFFGLTVLNHIRSGRDWPETLLFPRVAYCRVPGIRLVGVVNTYTAQCALPINMLNEKIYIFLWFWIMFLMFACISSLILWLVRMVWAPKRYDFIKRFLRVKNIKSHGDTEINRVDVHEFVNTYLRRDGVFLLKMLALNAGEVVTADIVVTLFEKYCESLAPPEDEKLLKNGSNQPPAYV